MKRVFKIIVLLTILASSTFNYVYAQEATSEGDSVLKKVREKVETLKKNPKAYIGTITDKTETSLQIKDVQGKIELVSVGDATHYTKLGKSETEIKFADFAIGDYVSALGTFAESQVLNARHILLTDAPVDSRKIISGTVKVKLKKTLTVDVDGVDTLLSFPTRWSGPEIKDISEGDSVVAVALQTGSALNIRTIEVLTQLPKN